MRDESMAQAVTSSASLESTAMEVEIVQSWSSRAELTNVGYDSSEVCEL